MGITRLINLTKNTELSYIPLPIGLTSSEQKMEINAIGFGQKLGSKKKN